MYLVEAYCLLGLQTEALKILQESSATAEVTHTVLSTSQQAELGDKVNEQQIMLINLAGVKLCQNDIIGAKDTIDELLQSLDAKLVTPLHSAAMMLPQHMIHTIVYFMLKTSKSLIC